jgi:ferredoxin
MSTSLIIGSGPAAAGVALALTAEPDQQVTVIDIGTTLEPHREEIRHAIAGLEESQWSRKSLAEVSHQPVGTGASLLPEKRTFGSDYPFRDLGQLDGIRSLGDANPAVVSSAYGGFSNVWGAQIMPFSAATFLDWPISSYEMEPHYRFALDEMSLSADEDDLAVIFPLLTTPQPLPQLSERTRKVLQRYSARRAFVQSHGITVGRARLAMRADDCSRCGLCMTGCPYGLIYSASQTFDRLRSAGRIAYRKDLMAFRVKEDGAIPTAEVRNLRLGTIEQISADRIFVACGGIGTTRIILNSLRLYNQPIELAESVQFVLPAASVTPTSDPRLVRNFTLNQFNLVFDARSDGIDLCQIHFYPYNPVFYSSLPNPLQSPMTKPLTTALLRRLSVGLGYLPSWASPKIQVTAYPTSIDELPKLTVAGDSSSGWPPLLREMMAALLRVSPALDLWPIVPTLSISPAAKSYHFGGSFPHRERRDLLSTDRLGRLPRWDNIHLVDASVFPNIPATTFTLTIMANAHRIASETIVRT